MMITTTLNSAKKEYGLTSEKYSDSDTWYELSCLPLPEDFIWKYRNKVNWYGVSRYSELSENFIKKCQDYVDWTCISRYQKLSEKFISKFRDKVNWTEITMSQYLSEKFIGKFKNYVDWMFVSGCHCLTENFIRRYKKYVDWSVISKYQPLSEDFIREFQDKVNWNNISKYQTVSKEFLKEFGYELRNNSDKPESYWKEQVQETGLYECYEDFFYAYKGIRSDRYSCYNFRYQYLPGKTYECFSDYSDFNRIDFGFSAGTRKWINMYLDQQLVIKVKIKYEDVTGINSDESIRCKRISIIN